MIKATALIERDGIYIRRKVREILWSDDLSTVYVRLQGREELLKVDNKRVILEVENEVR